MTAMSPVAKLRRLEQHASVAPTRPAIGTLQKALHSVLH